MNKTPLVSIIIPIFKVEKYLEKCVESVINQTYSNLEIILVDDGSPDKCPEICDEYKRRDKRVKVIHKRNGGLSDARNVGLSVASGNYVSLIDSDDYVSNDFIEVLLKEMISSESDVAVCAYHSFYDDGDENSSGNNKKYVSRTILPLQAIYKLYSRKDYLVYTVVWNKLYKAELFKHISFPLGKLHEDEFTTYKLLLAAKKIQYLNCGMYYYRQRKTSIMGQETKKNLFIKIEALEERKRNSVFMKNKKLLALNEYKILFYKTMLLKEKLISTEEYKLELNIINKMFIYLPFFKKISLIKKRFMAWNI